MQRGLNDVHAPNALDSARGTVSASARRYQYSFFRMMFSRVTVKPINDAWSFSIASGLFPAFFYFSCREAILVAASNRTCLKYDWSAGMFTALRQHADPAFVSING
jgi:hypothetical protein